MVAKLPRMYLILKQKFQKLFCFYFWRGLKFTKSLSQFNFSSTRDVYSQKIKECIFTFSTDHILEHKYWNKGGIQYYNQITRITRCQNKNAKMIKYIFCFKLLSLWCIKKKNFYALETLIHFCTHTREIYFMLRIAKMI